MNSDFEQKRCPLLIVISAPSGGGKTTICQQVLAARPEMTRAITCTTRAPRAGEKHGLDYYFLDVAAFNRAIAVGEFLEYATVFGNSYGTLKREVLEKLRQGKDVLLTVDVQGAATIRKVGRADPELKKSLVTVFLTPPSISILEERLRKRGSDSAVEIEQRLQKARQEIAEWPKYDYLLISTSIAEDLRRMLAIIEVEKMRARRTSIAESNSGKATKMNRKVNS